MREKASKKQSKKKAPKKEKKDEVDGSKIGAQSDLQLEVPFGNSTSDNPNLIEELRKKALEKALNSDDLEKIISDVIRVEGGIIGFSMVALGFVLNAISSFNQTNIGLLQIAVFLSS